MRNISMSIQVNVYEGSTNAIGIGYAFSNKKKDGEKNKTIYGTTEEHQRHKDCSGCCLSMSPGLTMLTLDKAVLPLD